MLLVVATKALWLVVPLLLAIILYYILLPIVHRLVVFGVGREAAAALVAGGVTLLAVGIMIPLLPWLAAQSVAGRRRFSVTWTVAACSLTGRLWRSSRSSTF